MNLRTTIALLLLACGLAAVLLFTRERIEDPKAPTVPVLGGRSLKEAIRIRWRLGPTSALVELTREGDEPFRLTEPIVDQVSAAFLRNLVASYDAEPLREAFPGEKLNAEQIAQLGLDPPRATLEAWFDDGKHVQIEIGGQDPLGRNYYVRRDGVIYCGGIGLWSGLQFNITDLRERQVFSNSPATATSLTIDQLGAGGVPERLRLVRQGAWYLEEPRKSRTESAASESFVVQVLSLRIDQFPPPPVRLPEREPDITITVDGSLGTETVKLWRDPSQHLIGDHLRRKVIFVSSDSQYNQIFVNVADRMRARWLIPLPDLPGELTRVVVDQGGDRPRIVLARQSAGVPFQLQEPVVSSCSPTPLAELIQALNNLRVVDYVEGKPAEARFGLAGESLTIEVLGQGQPKGTVLKFGADASERRSGIDVTYAQRRDEPDDVVAVPKAAVDLLRRPWSVYPELKVLTLLPGTPVELVRVRSRDAAPDIEYRRKEGRWRRGGADTPLDWVGNVVDEIGDLRGISADMSRRLQLGDADRTIDLCRGNGDEFATLLVWDRGKGQPLRARMKSKDALVFELDELRSDYLRKLWQ